MLKKIAIALGLIRCKHLRRDSKHVHGICFWSCNDCGRNNYR